MQIAVADVSHHDREGLRIDRLDARVKRIRIFLHPVDGEADIEADPRGVREAAAEFDAGIADAPDRGGGCMRGRERGVEDQVVAHRRLEQFLEVGMDPLGVAAGSLQQNVERMVGRQRPGHALHALDGEAVVGIPHHLECGQFAAETLPRQPQDSAMT